MSDYAKLLTKEGILYTEKHRGSCTHSWDSGWVPDALAALRQDSIKFRPDDNNLPLAGQVPAAPMSPRVIAGIAFGALVVLVVIAGLGWLLWRKRTRFKPRRARPKLP